LPSLAYFRVRVASSNHNQTPFIAACVQARATALRAGFFPQARFSDCHSIGAMDFSMALFLCVFG
jgi:hypothetical protein